jgi:hypothetical protein
MRTDAKQRTSNGDYTVRSFVTEATTATWRLVPNRATRTLY